MSTPLTTQIRDYFAYVDDQQGAVDTSVFTDRFDQLSDSFELDEGDLIMVDIQTRETDTDQPDEKTHPQVLRYVILAAAAVVVVIVAIALFDGTEETFEVDVVDSPADVDAPGQTEQVTPEPTDEAPSPDVSGDPGAFTESDALEMVDAYYMAIEADDAEAIAAAFSPETLFKVDSWVTEQIWAVATGTALSSPMACDASDGEPGSFVVNCLGSTRDYLHQLVNAPTTPFQFWYTVTAEGIERVEGRSFQEPPTASAFNDWMIRNHPEDSGTATGLLTPESIEEARANGELYHLYADLWADYLIQEGCTHDEIGC